MDTATFKGVEMLMIFGGLFAFCLHQLWSVRREARKRAEREAAARAAGVETPQASSIPAWMTDRSKRG